jgi:hypothetical protein
MTCTGSSCRQGRRPCTDECKTGADIARITVLAVALPLALVVIFALLGWLL